MSRLKYIPRERCRWQEAFFLQGNRCICPTCGERIGVGRPWGMTYWADVPEDDKDFTIHRCPVCKQPFLKERRRDDESV